MADFHDFQGIASYGLYWERDKVQWWPGPGGRIQLLGGPQVENRQFDPNNQEHTIDFSRQRGIYLLHHGHEVMYVGHTAEVGANVGLFFRLRSHYSSPRRGPLWDRFSWFGFRPVENGEIRDIPIDMGQHVPMGTLIQVVETVLIQACMPRLNGQAGQLLGTIYGQVRDPNLPQ